MKYINLVDKLTKEEIATLQLYLTKFGALNQYRHISVEEWLEQWSHSNQKLYRLLGNSFIYKIPFKYTKPRQEVRNEMCEFITGSKFKEYYHEFYYSFIKEKKDTFAFTEEDIKFFNHLMDISNFTDNKIYFGIKYKKPNGKKMLQIQPEAKPLKAIYRVMEYFKDDWEWGFATKAFEDFKKKFGIITSVKETQGTFCVSIHPLDYITMSDNASKWNSCMSWEDDGCYRVGTIEMMNSNNVLCCYLENENTHFVFDREVINPNTGELVGVWNNKKWRQLFYFTKDIIMGGKSYPYDCKELTLKILSLIKGLANENLNYTYEYGPELYQDMKYVTTNYRMKKQKMWAKTHSPKANIIWDTKGMYNDMLNDNGREYWCFRNKVAHTKVISVSGKANCICCNGSIIAECDDEYYNDRYTGTGKVVCKKCLAQTRCDYCGCYLPTDKLYITKDNKKICQSCADNFRICPCCNKPFKIYDDMMTLSIYKNDELFKEWEDGGKKKINFKETSFIKRAFLTREHFEECKGGDFIPLDKIVICKHCYKKGEAIIEEIKNKAVLVGTSNHLFFNEKDIQLLPPGVGDDYLLSNLKQASFKDLGILD